MSDDIKMPGPARRLTGGNQVIQLKSSLIGAGIASLALVSYTGFAQADTKPTTKLEDKVIAAASQGDHVTISGQEIKAKKNADGSYTITGKDLKVSTSPFTTTYPAGQMPLIPKLNADRKFDVALTPSVSAAPRSSLITKLAAPSVEIARAQDPLTLNWARDVAVTPTPSMAGGPTTMTANGKYLYICQGTKVYRLDAMTLAVLATTDLAKPKNAK